MTVGNNGSSNSLTISNGGTVANIVGSIGAYSSNNSVLVTGTNSITGTNSLWTNSGALIVGAYGSGNTLVISNRGTVANTEGYIGFYGTSSNTSSNNSVLVTGANSLWTNSNTLYVGLGGSGNSHGHFQWRHGGQYRRLHWSRLQLHRQQCAGHGDKLALEQQRLYPCRLRRQWQQLGHFRQR